MVLNESRLRTRTAESCVVVVAASQTGSRRRRPSVEVLTLGHLAVLQRTEPFPRERGAVVVTGAVEEEPGGVAASGAFASSLSFAMPRACWAATVL
jgi:hypothetical protein